MIPLPSVKMDDLPFTKIGKAILAMVLFLTAFIALGAVLTMGLFALVRGEARAEAVLVVKEDREQFKKDAMEAAKTAAREGVHEAVEELAPRIAALEIKVSSHEEKDDERVSKLKEETKELRQAVYRK